MNKPAAIYSRVSSDRQKENRTITSQTAALKEYAATHGYLVPVEWVFEDDGYSGAHLVRPGLESIRDLAAQGQIETVLVYSPDRLSRKYAYQVVLTEEFNRCGVSLIFLKAPSGETPEDQLLVQFQGMIAEYERAQIAERTRRGKRHKAQQGIVNVLGGAPYGYRYVKKTDSTEAYYQVIEAEAAIVRMIFEAYTVQGLSVYGVSQLLNERQIPTRHPSTRWQRSTIWVMLKNPAYQGRACFGKTQTGPRKKVLRNRLPTPKVGSQERPRLEWIEIPVPALVSEAAFALAQEQLQNNKHYAARRTIKPTLLQGMLVCQQCGSSLYRSSTKKKGWQRCSYRCPGREVHRRMKGVICQSRPVRQDYLDEFIWNEAMRLLDNPALIQSEIDRRMKAACDTDPLRKREQDLRHQQTRVENHMGRLVTAYQEELITLTDLRDRMPPLRKQQLAIETQIRSFEEASEDQSRYVRLVATLSEFRESLRARAQTLDVLERQKILRLVIREIIVAADTIRICHSIPVVGPRPDGNSGTPSPSSSDPNRMPPLQSYLLHSRNQNTMEQWNDARHL